MITAQLLDQQQLQTGDETLIKHWQETGRGVIWIDIEAETDAVEQQWLATLGGHPLAIQDSQRTRHPPKIEHFDDNSFILYRPLAPLGEDLAINSQRLAFFISDNCLVSIHKTPLDCIQAIRQLPALAGLMQCPAEIMCAIIRHSASSSIEDVLGIEETLSELEEAMADAANDRLLNDVTFYRTRLRKLKRLFAYHDRMFGLLLKEPELLPARSETIHHSLQDVYDKFERLLNLTAMYYDLCGDLSDAYLSLASHRLNRTMQLLTVITAIFVPLTFLAGVYGMNFIHMPELQWRYGYFIILAIMATTAAGLVALFRHRKWL